ncbi:hypothetical protein [Metamycoplasma salivarium]|uniref:hypothetical protein n=1 Tax=Metamycoplasma salivarium TaxID=2124 RepID=UPI001F311F4A|nr:hypothetical protein [Metamycoplasma salivarium]GIZ06831.1 hypothetical protein MSATCC33130_1850 [Metamycoplasma salivarium]
MKKLLTNLSLLTLSLLPILFVASRCNPQKEDNYFEKRAKETDDQIESRYVNEYIQKENYIFDDFEQFKFNRKRHFYKPDVDQNALDFAKDSNNNYPLIQDFEIWHNDFVRHYNIFKNVIDKYAPNKKTKYSNINNNINSYQYFVKEIIFDFNVNNRIDADWYLLISWTPEFWPMLNKILELPNLNLNIATPKFPIHKIISSNLYQGRYLSKLNFVSDYMYYDSKEKNYAWTKEDYATLMSLTSIPKPKLLPEIKDENSKFNDKPASISIKAGHADEFNDTSYTAWRYSAASYEQFFETFLDYDDRKIRELTGKYMYNGDPIKFHSPIVEIVKYKDQRIKETYTHYRFRAEKGNEDIKIFKWWGEVPKK